MYRTKLKVGKPQPHVANSIKNFRAYLENMLEIKMLKDNYDNHFSLRIEGDDATKVQKEEKKVKIEEVKVA